MLRKCRARPSVAGISAYRCAAPGSWSRVSGAACRALRRRPWGRRHVLWSRRAPLDRTPLALAGRRSAFRLQPRVVDRECFALTQHDATLDHVLQLTDIAGPVVRLE